MKIQFKKKDKIARILNPFNNFEPSEVKCQIRWDPLTGRSGRLAHFVGFKPQPPDLSRIIEDSKKNCPFCPENVHTMTPKFSPDQIAEGRLEKGESVLFPNLLPYDEHSALATLCSQHYKSLDEFSPEIFYNAFSNCLDYLNRVVPKKNENFALVTWNYLPSAGSSQIHPHFQVYVTEAPGNFLPEMISAGRDYLQETGRTYWEDYLKEEIKAGERLIKEQAGSVWLADFVSLSVLSDVVGIFPERQTLFDLRDEEIEEAAGMLDNILKYFGGQGVYSLNLAWMPGLEGQKEHWLQVRISPRLYLAPQVWCTETPSLFYQYQESFMVWPPEETARELRDAVS